MSKRLLKQLIMMKILHQWDQAFIEIFSHLQYSTLQVYCVPESQHDLFILSPYLPSSIPFIPSLAVKTITNSEQQNLHQQSVCCLIFFSQTQNHTCSLSLVKRLAARTTGRTAYDICPTCDWSLNASVLSSFNCAVTHEPKE